MLSSFYRVSKSHRPPLRVGIVVDSTSIPRFYAEVIDDIQLSNFARIEAVGLLRAGVRKSDKGFLFAQYNTWDQGRVDSALDPMEPVDVAGKLAGVPAIEAEALADGQLPERITDALVAQRLDVLLWMSSDPLMRPLTNCARNGTWAYQFADGIQYGGTPPYFWETRDGCPISGVVLRDLDENRVLCRGVFENNPQANVSWARNRLRPMWGSVFFIIRKLFELHQRQSNRAVPPQDNRQSETVGMVRTGMPGNWDMARWLVPKLSGKTMRRALRLGGPEHWRMAVRVGPRRLWNNVTGGDTDGFKWIDSPPGHLYADPFLIRRRDRPWIFYEHYHYAEKRAVIDCAELLPDGQLGEPRVALRRNYHLSFPHIVEHDGDVFMIPETGRNRTVELYRAIRFPDEWKLEKVLLSGHWAVDTAVWHDGHRWWFFATMKESRGEGSMLMLFHASELTGEWQLHPMSPICTDIRAIRGAGAIFEQDGKLLRPSQDGSVRYGYRLNLQEIVALNPEEYEEKPLFTLHPSEWPGTMGVHTYNQCAGAEVLDGCIRATAAATGGHDGLSIAPTDEPMLVSN